MHLGSLDSNPESGLESQPKAKWWLTAPWSSSLGQEAPLSGPWNPEIAARRRPSDSSQGLQQLPRSAATPQRQHDSNALAEKVPKAEPSNWKKKVSSQEIHFLPIKKQRLAALFPRK
ncbi:retinoic acid-induced protein 2 [Lates japonicus]|uniref:Retinoic acid-induced protein 2 n=1 Tax=Lates japonicus TaxID=270547 RepID=A0AAD3N5X9_LATJO|nr:retinoic acid-induced protein 2 [Lates japonicus]